MKTSFINLSNKEVSDFVKSNPRLDVLVREAKYLDGNLKEESSKAKEDKRTELGAFHSALALNHELSQSNKQEVLENVLKLMHNSAMRVVEFFEHVVKTAPNKEVKDEDKNTDIIIKKNVFDKAIYYCLQQKDGKNITITLYKDPNKDSNYYDSYKIEYSDSLEPYSRVRIKPEIELRSTEENLEFSTMYNADQFILKSIKAHSSDQRKPADLDCERMVRNMEVVIQAQGKAEEEIPLQRLNLDQDTVYIKNLYEALNQKFQSSKQ